MNDVDALRARFTRVRAEIDAATDAAGRSTTSVCLVAVSKFHPFEKIRALYELGHRDFGENYVQELAEKAARARTEGLDGIRWHFIGHLQKNKVKVLLPDASIIHSVDSLRLAEEISKRAGGGRVAILIEVNLDGEATKSGTPIEDLETTADSIARLPGLELRGLMCIPDPERAGGAREAFRQLAALAAARGLPVLSMGMTADFREAIAEGATHVRIGTAIFGERSPREKV